MEPIQIMVEDLGRQVAQKAVEQAEWKARALVAEAALAAITAEMEETDEAPDNVVALVPTDDADGDDERGG